MTRGTPDPTQQPAPPQPIPISHHFLPESVGPPQQQQQQQQQPTTTGFDAAAFEQVHSQFAAVTINNHLPPPPALDQQQPILDSAKQQVVSTTSNSFTATTATSTATSPEEQQQQQPPTSRRLFVCNLDVNVTQETLEEACSAAGEVTFCRLIHDRETNISTGYGLIEFATPEIAQSALLTLSGKQLMEKFLELHLLDATAETDTPFFPLFVGDLAPEIDDAMLLRVFRQFGTCCESRVMWDPNTQRSRGYGFVAFRIFEDAEKALEAMNGASIGSRQVRVNWATQRQTALKQRALDSNNKEGGGAQRTVYVGNLPFSITEQIVVDLFTQFGPIQQIRLQFERGFAFVTFYSPADAAIAIDRLNGKIINSKPIKCAWGKERERETRRINMTASCGYGGVGYNLIPSYPAPTAAPPHHHHPYPYPHQQVQPHLYPCQVPMYGGAVPMMPIHFQIAHQFDPNFPGNQPNFGVQFPPEPHPVGLTPTVRY